MVIKFEEMVMIFEEMVIKNTILGYSSCDLISTI
jgi:hypothetical protein